MPPVRAPSRLSFGGRLPPIIGLLIVTTFVASVVAALGLRHGFPLFELSAFVPDRLLRGELWRTVTWVFLELEPMGLLFACLSLYWFGRDLALRWGPGRFLAYYLGLAASVAGITFLVSRVYTPIAAMPFYGTWPVQEALIILWASYYPTRQIRVYFIVPLAGRQLIVLTVAGTVLYAVFHGIDQFIPHFIAEALALAVMALPSPRAMWMEAKLSGMEKKRRGGHLKAVPREPKDEPPGGRWLN